VEWRVFADFGNGDFRQNRKIGEGRTTHIVVKLRPADREARRAVRHDALPLRRANGGAEVGFPRQAGRAIAALGRVERNDMVAFFDRGHAGPKIDDHARTSWPRMAGKSPSGSAPDKVNSSVWQMPVALISTRTSPARGPSSCTVVTSSGLL